MQTTYLTVLTIGLCTSYFILLTLFSVFFKGKLPRVQLRSVYSVLLIAIASGLSYAISYAVPDPQLSNRVLHVVGGGFVSFFVCFLVTKDSRFSLTTFQFVIFSILIVTTMGVCNELSELFVQTHSHMIFSDNQNDTWLDLLSNSIGIALGVLVFTPFIHKSRKK